MSLYLFETKLDCWDKEEGEEEVYVVIIIIILF